MRLSALGTIRRRRRAPPAAHPPRAGCFSSVARKRSAQCDRSFAAKRLEIGLMPLAPLGERHRQRAVDGLADAFRIVRIDQQRRGQFVRGAGKARQDQHAGIVGVLRGDEFLGHQVHAVAQRRHQRRARGAVETGERGAAMRLVDVAQRRPRRLAIGAVDAADRLAHLAADVGIFRNAGAAARRDLQIGHLAAPVREIGEEALERVHALGDALGVIEPVDADDHGAAGQAVEHLAHECGCRRRGAPAATVPRSRRRPDIARSARRARRRRSCRR